MFKKPVLLLVFLISVANLHAQKFVPNIPIDEQNQIVSFLDNKIEKIDYLIEKIEQKIKLQKEQKSSLIHESSHQGLLHFSEFAESFGRVLAPSSCAAWQPDPPGRPSVSCWPQLGEDTKTNLARGPKHKPAPKSHVSQDKIQEPSFTVEAMR